MRLREVVRTDGRRYHVNRPTTTETLAGDVMAVLSRSRVNRGMATDAGKVEELAERLRGGRPVRVGRATYSLLGVND